MSASAFQQLRAVIAAHLEGDPALSGVPVYAGRARPIAQEEPVAITVRLADSQAIRPLVEATDWHTVVMIDCAARAVPGGADADSAADTLLSAVYTRLHSLAAPAVAVLEVSNEATVAWDHVAEDVPYTCATLSVTCVHRTPGATLQPWT